MDDSITHAPIREEERGQAARDRRPPRSAAERYVWPGVGALFVVLAVVVGLMAGWAYAIPFAILAALALLFFGSGGAIARWRQHRYGGVEEAHRAVQEDADDSVPSTDFGERAEEPEQQPAGAESAEEPHADMHRGPA
jgi:hypothetical protein